MLLPLSINITCACIVICCIMLCVLADYELIPSYWFMVGLICGCTVFFGTISANIYVDKLSQMFTSWIDWGNNAANGNIAFNANGNDVNVKTSSSDIAITSSDKDSSNTYTLGDGVISMATHSVGKQHNGGIIRSDSQSLHYGNMLHVLN